MLPIGELEDFAAQEKIMYDLLALAYQADLTRVATYITVAEGTNRTYLRACIHDSPSKLTPNGSVWCLSHPCHPERQ